MIIMQHSDVYTRHKPIRNKIKARDPYSIILTGIEILRETVDNYKYHELSSLQCPYMPWNILNIIRWVFQYNDLCSNQKAIDRKGFHDELYRPLSKIDILSLEGQKSDQNIKSVLKRDLFFQLPFQIRSEEIISGIGRQLIMFEDIGKEYGLGTKFQEKTGLSIPEFLTIYLTVLMDFQKNKAVKVHVSRFLKILSNESFKNFLNLVGMNLEAGRIFI